MHLSSTTAKDDMQLVGIRPMVPITILHNAGLLGESQTTRLHEDNGMQKFVENLTENLDEVLWWESD